MCNVSLELITVFILSSSKICSHIPRESFNRKLKVTNKQLISLLVSEFPEGIVSSVSCALFMVVEISRYLCCQRKSLKSCFFDQLYKHYNSWTGYSPRIKPYKANISKVFSLVVAQKHNDHLKYPKSSTIYVRMYTKFSL